MTLDPKVEFDARYWRGLAFDGLREDSQVARDLSVCIEHDRGDLSQRERLESALHHRAAAHLMLGAFAEAMADLEEIATFRKLSAAQRALRGQAWSQLLDFGKALEDFKQAVKDDPKNMEAWNGLGYVKACASDAKFRNGAEAVHCAERACELSGWLNWVPISVLAGAWAESGDFEKAIQHAERALELAPDFERPERVEKLELYRRGMPYRHDGSSRSRRPNAK